MQTSSVTIIQEQIKQIVGDVFASMLQMHVSFSEEPEPLKPELWAASIQFMGESLSRLQIHLSLEQCLEVTSRLMRIPRPTQFNEDVQDALGELANMIGGNLKALLPYRAEISLPAVYPPEQSRSAAHDSDNVSFVVTSEMGCFFVTFEESVANASAEPSPHTIRT